MSIIKGLIKLAGAVIVIGLVLLITGFVVGGFNLGDLVNGFSADEEFTLVEVNEEFSVQEVFVNVENNIVKFTLSEDEKFHITYYSAEFYPFTHIMEDGVLSLVGKQNRPFSFFNYKYTSAKVRTVSVQVPASFSGSLDVYNSNGSIEVTGLTVSEMNFRTSNGSVSGKNCTVSGDVTFSSLNGDVSLNNCTISGNTVLSTSNGKINSQDVTAAKYKGTSSNGSINVKGIVCNDVDVSTSNGSIEVELSGDSSQTRIDVSTSLGSIYLDGFKISNQVLHPTASNKLKAKTSNGSIKLTFQN